MRRPVAALVAVTALLIAPAAFGSQETSDFLLSGVEVVGRSIYLAL